MHDQETDNEQQQRKPGFWDIVKSTFAAALGVQSTKNRERDFSHGSIKTFAVAGILFTIVFILIVIGVVKLVLSAAGV